MKLFIKSKRNKIGIWQDCEVFLNGSKDKPYWTIEKSGKIMNQFDDAESFGHWIYHSGWRASK